MRATIRAGAGPDGAGTPAARARPPGRRLGRALEAAQLDEVLARDAQAMPAGGQDPQPRAGGEQPPRQAGACGEQPLAAVQHQQHGARPQVRQQVLLLPMPRAG